MFERIIRFAIAQRWLVMLATIALMVAAVFALLFYAVGMTVCYLSDDVVTPRLQLRKERRMRAAAVKYETRRMVHSDLE